MSCVVFIGDEVTGAGFQLAGARVITPDPEQLEAVIQAERNACDMMMISTETARMLPRELYNDMLVWTRPLVAFVPDIRLHEGPLALGQSVRRELGIEV